jgi:hypothetical protein
MYKHYKFLPAAKMIGTDMAEVKETGKELTGYNLHGIPGA